MKLCQAAYKTTRIRGFQKAFNNYHEIVCYNTSGYPIFELKNIFFGPEADLLKKSAMHLRIGYNLEFLKRYFPDYEKFCWVIIDKNKVKE